MKDKSEIIKALAACSEFECCNCPYQHLDDEEYPLRCIHALIKDTYGMLEVLEDIWKSVSPC